MKYVFRKKALTVSVVGLALLATITLWLGSQYISVAQDAAQAEKSRSYPLRFTNAVDVAPRMQGLLADIVGSREVKFDRRSNTISVQGDEATQRVVAKLLETLDRASTGATPENGNAPQATEPTIARKEEFVPRGYRVDPQDPDVVAARLRNQLGMEPGIRIAVDSRTKQIVVVAPPRVHDRVNGIISAVDSGTTTRGLSGGSNPLPSVLGTNSRPSTGTNLGTESTTYQLKHISAENLEAGLKRIWGPSVAFFVDQKTNVMTAKLPSTQPEPALVQIDRQRALVSFTGATDVKREWMRIVQTLDQPRLPPGADAQVLPINRADPEQIRRTLNVVQASFGNKQDDEVSATIPARGAGRGAAKGAQGNELLARNFQNQNPPKDGDLPKNAQAPLDNSKPDPKDDDPDEDSGLIGNVQIEFLEGLDVIIVRGKKRDVERVTKIINDIERLSTETRPAIEILPLEHVNSQAVSEVVAQVYDQILSARQGRVSITALVKPNAILLIGRQESIAVVTELVKKLDHPVAPESLWQVFPLKYTSVTEAEQTVSKLFGVTPTTGVGAQAVPAPPVNQNQAAQAGQLGIGGVSSSTVSLKSRLTVVSDFRSNSLVVQGSPRDLDDVAALIKQIDVEANTATTELRIFKLQNTLAQEMAPVLQDALRGNSRTTQGGQAGGGGGAGPFQQNFGAGGGGGAAGQNQLQARSTNLQFVTVDPVGNRILQAGVPSDIFVSADITANALVVRAPAKSMELIGALIKELDSLPDASSQIKVFTIVNGDATNLAAMLQQLFGQQVTIGRGTGGLFGGGQAQQLNLAPQGGANAGDSSLVPLRFAVDVRSNSIMTSGSSGDLAVVETLLLRLDEGDVPARKMSVYRLKNAFAQDVATAITSLLQSQRQVIQTNQIFNQAIGPFEQLEREMLVQAEPQTNSLVISATPRFYDDLLRVVKTLDYRPPMVMVQVLIAEITLNDLYEFGVELGLQESLLFDRGKANPAVANSAAVPGFNFNPTGSLPNVNSLNQNTLASQALSGFATGRSNSTLGYGGLVLSAASDSVNILVRALQDVGRLQVLSRPQVMAIHNRQAQVIVGQKVPRVQGSTATNTGVTQNIVDVDIGLILNIIPQINDDGVVVLNVQAQNSKLGNTALSIPSSNNAPPTNIPSIDNTSAVTTISARDGQTVVFAGLIQTTKQQINRRVPYLSDIPVLGKLFQYKQDNNVRKELMIVMTPHIIKDDQDYDWLKGVESDRMNWCLGDVVNVNGDVGLRGNNCLFCPEHIPIIYPDQDPAGYVPHAPKKGPGVLGDPIPPAFAPRKTSQTAPLSPVPSKYAEMPVPDAEPLPVNSPRMSAAGNFAPTNAIPTYGAVSPATNASNGLATGDVNGNPSMANRPNLNYGNVANLPVNSSPNPNPPYRNELRNNNATISANESSRIGGGMPQEPAALPSNRGPRSAVVEPAAEPLSSNRSPYPNPSPYQIQNQYPIAPVGYQDNRGASPARLP